jgi:hypothetical protein
MSSVQGKEGLGLQAPPTGLGTGAGTGGQSLDLQVCPGQVRNVDADWRLVRDAEFSSSLALSTQVHQAMLVFLN